MAVKKRTIAIAVVVVLVIAGLAYFGGLLSISTPCPLTPNPTGSGFQADFSCTVTTTSTTYYFNLVFYGNYGPVNNLHWNFGDGSPELTCTAGPHGGCNTILRPTHEYTSTGTFTVSLSMSDSGGHSANVVHSLTLAAQNPPPSSAPPAITNLTVDLVGNTVAPADLTFYAMFDGGTSPFRYTWSFGDGTTSTDANPTHTFSSGGNFTVAVTVTDANSKTATASKLVTVESASGGGGGGNETGNQTTNKTAFPVAIVVAMAFIFSGVLFLAAYVRFRTVIVVLVGAGLFVIGIAVLALTLVGIF